MRPTHAPMTPEYAFSTLTDAYPDRSINVTVELKRCRVSGGIEFDSQTYYVSIVPSIGGKSGFRGRTLAETVQAALTVAGDTPHTHCGLCAYCKAKASEAAEFRRDREEQDTDELPALVGA